MAYDYLSDLNREQRRAHGVSDGSAFGGKPLLVIAGAGTGKTKTLAHRVAHLIVNGVDAHRILLLTFSRRAAFDMTGRVRPCRSRCARQKKSNSGLQSACDELIDKGAIHHSE
jgi:ATP-dependent DNA helicase UvrD/PcrA